MANSAKVPHTSHLPVVAPKAKRGAGSTRSFATIQRQLEANWDEPLEMPSYSPAMANRAAANLLGVSAKPKTGTDPAQQEVAQGTIQRVCADCTEAQEAEAEQATIQPKLTIGQPGDKYEQEADATAAKVMRMADPVASQGLQQQAETEEEELQEKPLVQPALQPAPQMEETALAQPQLQRQPQALAEQADAPEIAAKEEEETAATLQANPSIQAKGDAPAAPANFESQLSQNRGSGSPLSDQTRAFMEPRFGADFSNVRIHETPDLANAIQAQAFTHGEDIYFNSGKYNPGSSGGKELLAHELTHVVQQNGAAIQPQTQPPENATVHAKKATPAISSRSSTGHLQAQANQSASQSASEEGNSPIQYVVDPKTQQRYIVEYRVKKGPQDGTFVFVHTYGSNRNLLFQNSVYSLADYRYPVDKTNFQYVRRASSGEIEQFQPGARFRLYIGDELISPVSTPAKDPPRLDKTFALKSDASSTVKRGTKVKFFVEQARETLVSRGSHYRFKWVILKDPTTTDASSRAISITDEPTQRRSITTYANYLGKQTIKVYVYLYEANQDDRSLVEILEYEQTVTDDGRTHFHRNLIDKANQTHADESVIEWSDLHGVSYRTNVERGRPNAPIVGLPNNMNIWDFKYQWVRGYAEVIENAAAEFDLPVVLLAGIAFLEVAGAPPSLDDAAYQIRKLLDGQERADRTSFGDLSIQVRRGAETLGYGDEPEKLSSQQRDKILNSLKEPRQNLFIAAKHLSDLRDINFPGKGAKELTRDEMMVIAGRYNFGPDPTVTLEELRPYTRGYGQRVMNFVDEYQLAELFD